MKYLILSDIHGSSKYLKMVIDKTDNFDKLIVLGDILYHGPRNSLPEGYNPPEVIAILNGLKNKIVAVRGNCDANVDLMVLDFKIHDNLWFNYENKKLFLTHGDVYNKDKLPSKFRSYTLLYGHFHKNEIVKVKNNICSINVGSLSIPKDGHFSYAIIENGFLLTYDLLTGEKILEVRL